MAWQDRFRRGSFKDIEFFINSHEYTSGRRNENHEFPYRSRNYAEDLGRKTPGYKMEAYLIGQDYDLQRDRLIKALSEEGPGTLVHPFLGSFEASVMTFSVKEEKSKLNMCTFDLHFIESGLKNFPAGLVDPEGSLGDLSSELKNLNNSTFDQVFSVINLPGNAIEDVNNTISDFENATGGFGVAAISELDLALRTLTSRTLELLSTPSRIRGNIINALDALENSITDSRQRFRRFLGIAEQSPSFDLRGTSYDNDRLRSQYAVTNLFRINALSVALTAANEIEFNSVSEQLEVRNRFTDMINNLLNSTIKDAKGNIISDITFEQRSQLHQLLELLLLRFPPFNENVIGEKIVSYDRTVNALSAFYQTTGRITGVDFFIQDNQIPNPVFIPLGKELKVLEI